MESGDLSYSWIADAQSYIDKRSLSSTSPSIELPIGQLLVKENQNWQEAIVCFDIPDPQQSNEAQAIFSATNDFLSQAVSKRSPLDQGYIELPSEIIGKAIKEFERNFDLRAGDYQIAIRLLSAEKEILAEDSAKVSLTQPEVDRVMSVSV